MVRKLNGVQKDWNLRINVEHKRGVVKRRRARAKQRLQKR